MRILLVSNMYPSPEHPGYGSFVERVVVALRARGHEIDESVLHAGRRGLAATPIVYAGLLARTLALSRRRRPDGVYAHYLVPTGLIATATRRPFVVTAHGTDVRNTVRSCTIRAVTRFVTRRADAVIVVSRFLADRLGGSPLVISMGVDTDAFRPAPRAEGESPRFIFVGNLNPRKNAGRLLEAFSRLEHGSLTIVGDGPLGYELRVSAPAGVRFAGRVPLQQLIAEIQAHDVLCMPSLEEPHGQVMLEGLACARPVVATRVGGPPEVITPECGALVDPLDVESIAAGMRVAAAAAGAVRSGRPRCIPVRRYGRSAADRSRAHPRRPSQPRPAQRPRFSLGSRLYALQGAEIALAEEIGTGESKHLHDDLWLSCCT
jgi:glycosyltransferase involved in cell wall biosynthesis